MLRGLGMHDGRHHVVPLPTPSEDSEEGADMISDEKIRGRQGGLGEKCSSTSGACSGHTDSKYGDMRVENRVQGEEGIERDDGVLGYSGVLARSEATTI